MNHGHGRQIWLQLYHDKQLDHDKQLNHDKHLDHDTPPTHVSFSIFTNFKPVH